MNATSDLVVPKEFLDIAKMSEGEMRVELAAHLYDTGRLTLGQARRLSGLDQIAFQNALAERNIFIHMDIEDVREDMANLGVKP